MEPVLTINKPRYTRQRFPQALKGLMQERRLSYRQLAYKTRLSAGYLNHLTKGTRPVPADPVISNIAIALRVEPDFFLEYRLRQVVNVLDKTAPLADRLYGVLVRRLPVPDDLGPMLEAHASGSSGGNGGNGGNGGTDERGVVSL
jgi:transcriptional regulator with XRE-family HTH domain